MKNDDLVYIWSNEHNAYWSPNCKGYVTSREDAGVYPLLSALAICRGANDHLHPCKSPYETIQPIPKDDIINLS